MHESLLREIHTSYRSVKVISLPLYMQYLKLEGMQVVLGVATHSWIQLKGENLILFISWHFNFASSFKVSCDTVSLET